MNEIAQNTPKSDLHILVNITLTIYFITTFVSHFLLSTAQLIVKCAAAVNILEAGDIVVHSEVMI